MKKITVACMLFITLFNTAHAQKKIAVYVAGNFGLASAKLQPSGSTTITSKLSGGIGLHLSGQLTKRFFIVAQPAINSRGYVSSNAVNKYDVSTTYIDIPAAIEYHYSLFKDMKDERGEYPFFIGAGLYGGFAIAGKYVDKYLNNPSVKIKFGESATDNRSKTDYGLNFVAGMTINDWGFGKFKTALRFGVQKQVGIKNVVPKDRQPGGNEIKLRNLSMFVAVKI
jgi:hypothetical protein